MTYRDTVNENSHQDLLKDAKCDNCGKPATRWFGSTSVRICDSQYCRERYQQEWNAISSSNDDDEDGY